MNALNPILSEVPRSLGGECFEYDQDDVAMINVPVADCRGDVLLTHDQLERYFGVEPVGDGQLPEYLITPRLHSFWNHNCPKGFWWDITGEVIVYKPIAWVPFVRKISTIPYTEIPTWVTTMTTNIRVSELYGSYEASFKLGAGIGIEGLKMELSNSISVKA
ncbi:hypothetical protein BGZ75_009889, partial [Mortierella antarctica]